MSSECGPCTKGQYLCPSDQQSCVDSAASYERCPRLNGTHLDHRLGIEQRIDYILAHTTLTEQIGQLTNNAPALTRLGIPSYNWLNDDLHGVGRTSKRATILPNGCGLAATWSTELLHAAGRVLGEEARGIHQEFLAGSDRGQHGNGKGITVYGPNLNLVRDPRWGRAQVSAKPSSLDPLSPMHPLPAGELRGGSVSHCTPWSRLRHRSPSEPSAPNGGGKWVPPGGHVLQAFRGV